MTHPPVGVPACYRHPDRETYIRCQRCDKAICPDCMHEASVGFQCPDCVAEGRRTTRSARTAYGGRRSADPGLTSKVLVGLNVLVWGAILATGWASSQLVDRLALTPLGHCGSEDSPGSFYPGVGQSGCASIPDGQWFPGAAEGAVWQLLTSAFTHVQIWHIAFNMMALWFLGPQLELALGRARFLALYLVSALAGSVCVLWLAGASTTTLGASGAVFGLMGALIVIGYKVGGDVSGLLGWIGANAVLTFLIPNVSWQGHLGGLVGGALIAAILVYAPKQRRTAVQVAGLAGVVLLLAAATVVRAVLLA